MVSDTLKSNPKQLVPAPKAPPCPRRISRWRELCWRASMRAAALPRLPRPGRLPAAAICLVGLLVIPIAASMQPSLCVTLDGRTVGYVTDASSVQLAANLLETSIETQFGVDYQFQGALEYHTVYTLGEQNDPVDKLVSALADASDDLGQMAVLSINGETIGACSSIEDVQGVLDDLLDTYKTSTGDRARFVENVNVTLSPAPADAEISAEELRQMITEQDLLDVEVYSTYEYTEPIPYATETVESEQLEQNAVRTIQVGQDGEAAIEEMVVTLNGVETQRTVSSRTVLTQATDAVVAVGTRGNGMGTGSLIVPVTNYTFTSAFKFRNGRWHKGVDLAVSEGTPVYASDSGKVIVSQWSDSYGNYIIIDHQNGFKTLYAHNSALLVNVGDTVTKGKQIALSGNTGNSTGPHVHFEVHYNGVAVNPELYLSFGEENP